MLNFKFANFRFIPVILFKNTNLCLFQNYFFKLTNVIIFFIQRYFYYKILNTAKFA